MSTSSSGSSSSIAIKEWHNVRINFENSEKDKDVIVDRENTFAVVAVLIDAISA